MFTYPGGFDPSVFPEPFSSTYRSHLKHQTQGPATQDRRLSHARTIRRMGDYFDHQIDNLSPAQLTDYFHDLVASHSWSAVKIDLYGFKFYTQHVLRKPWAMPDFIKPPKVSRLPDIVTVEEAQALFSATRTLSYRVFYFILYSLGLRLSEGLALTVADIDAARHRVHIRTPKAIGIALSRCHRQPSWSCADSGKRTKTLCCCSPIAWAVEGGQLARTPLDRGGVQKTLHQVATDCGLKKDNPPQPSPQLWNPPDRVRG